MYSYKNVEDVKVSWPLTAAVLALVAGFLLSLGMPAVDHQVAQSQTAVITE